MHLAEAYSQFVGLKPGKPFIQEDYYPLQFDKYIVIQQGAGMSSKQYDQWHHVVEHSNIPIVQLGGEKDEQLPVAMDLRGKTTFNQSAYLLRNCSLFLGCDSVCNHIASAFGVPRIALFGPTSPLTCGGYFNRDKGIEKTPVSMQGCQSACHNPECIKPIKCINSITPESILEDIARILGQDAVKPVRFLHQGAICRQQILEWLPVSVNESTFKTMSMVNGVISLRADLYHPNLKELSNLCNQTPHKYVMLVEPKNLEDISIHHSKIERILVMINKENASLGIQAMKMLSKKLYKVGLISYLDHSEFNEFKLDMLDFPPIARINQFDVKPEHELWVGQTLNIKTNRKIVGHDGKFFLTYHDALKNQNPIEISKDNVNTKVESEHLKELQFLTIRQYA